MKNNELFNGLESAIEAIRVNETRAKKALNTITLKRRALEAQLNFARLQEAYGEQVLTAKFRGKEREFVLESPATGIDANKQVICKNVKTKHNTKLYISDLRFNGQALEF